MFGILQGLVFILFLVAFMGSSARAQEVHGVVRDVTGLGLSNVLVEAYVFDETGYVELAAVTDTTGRYAFPFSPGRWSVEPSESGLNAIGRLSVASASVELTNGGQFISFTTRQLDLHRLVSGSVRDQFDHPVAGLQLSASIRENFRSYETNFATGSDGRFAFGASAAIWQIQAIGTSLSNLFPDLSVAVEPHDIGKELSIVAPRTTTSITGTLTNSTRLQLRAECFAFGHYYRISKSVSWNPETFNLSVFPGTWTLVVTNSPGWISRSSPSAPVTVEVADEPVQISFEPVQRQVPVTRTVDLFFVTPSGVLITNTTRTASARRNNGELRAIPAPPPPGSSPPVFSVRLQLEDGPWEIISSVEFPGASNWWSVTQPVVISSNGPTNVTVVFPDNAVSPRILGHARDSDGPPLVNQRIQIDGAVDGTNHSTQCVTDAAGNFSVPAISGKWAATVLGSGWCDTKATFFVSEASQTVELVHCTGPNPAETTLAVTVTNDFADPDVVYWISRSGANRYFGTNLSGGMATVLPVLTGLSGISVSPPPRSSFGSPYEVFPRVKHLQSSLLPTNLFLRVAAGTARVEGRLRDTQGKLITAGNVMARASVAGVDYSVSGAIESGYFSLNVMPGEWEIAASVAGSPPLHGTGPRQTVVFVGRGNEPLAQYTDPPNQFLRVTNGLNLCEFVVEELPAQVPLSVAVVQEDGSAMTNVAVVVSGSPSVSVGATSQAASRQFNVRPGSMTISALAIYTPFPASNVFILPSLRVTISTNSSNHIVLVAKAATKCLGATIQDQTGGTLPFPIRANIEINGTNYSTSGCLSVGSGACVPIFPGVWRIGIPDYPANEFSFESTPLREHLVPVVGQPMPVHFVLEPLAADFRQATLLSPSLLPDGRLLSRLNANAGFVWRIDVSDDFNHWTPLFTVFSANGSADVTLPRRPIGQREFYRAIWID